MATLMGCCCDGDFDLVMVRLFRSISFLELGWGLALFSIFVLAMPHLDGCREPKVYFLSTWIPARGHVISIKVYVFCLSLWASTKESAFSILLKV